MIIKNNLIDECNLWWFQMVDQSIFDLSDLPSNVVSRIGSGKIEVGSNIACDLDSFVECIITSYGFITDTAYFKQVLKINNALGEIKDWSNTAFATGDDWQEIRLLARDAFALKYEINNSYT